MSTDADADDAPMNDAAVDATDLVMDTAATEIPDAAMDDVDAAADGSFDVTTQDGPSDATEAVDSGTSDRDAGDAGDDAIGMDGPVTLFGLSPGTWCFDIVSIAVGFNDGCDLGVATLVGGTALPVNYETSTGTLTVGTDGALGQGPIRNNRGTLIRDREVTDPGAPACHWHQIDTTMVVLTDTNDFSASVVETESNFSAGCSGVPTGGTCTSNWTWRMRINGARNPLAHCQ